MERARRANQILILYFVTDLVRSEIYNYVKDKESVNP